MDMVSARRWPVAAIGALLTILPAVSGAEDTARPPYCGTEQWQPFIHEAAARFDIPEAWLHEVMRVESAGCAVIDGRPITSTAGAMGLMQLMPATWERMRRALRLGVDPYDPHDNIVAAAGYLRDLFDRYGEPGVFAAYHAGPLRYEQYLLDERSLPATTLNYLARLQRIDDRRAARETLAARPVIMPRASLFVTRERPDRAHREPPDRRARVGPFITLTRDAPALGATASDSTDVQHD